MAAAAGYELVTRADKSDETKCMNGNDNCGDVAERAQQNGKVNDNNNSKPVSSSGSPGIFHRREIIKFLLPHIQN